MGGYAPIAPDGFFTEPDYNSYARTRNPLPYRSTHNPKDAAEMERQYARWLGDVSNQEFQDYGVPMYQKERRYQSLGDQAYAPFLTGGGGYDPETQARLRDTARLEGLELTPEQEQRRFLTPEEQAEILGDPYSAFDYYDPSRFDQTNFLTAMGQRGFAGDASVNQRGALGSHGGTIRDIYGNEELLLDPEFSEGYRMSDAEVQDISDLGAKTAAERYRGWQSDLERRAAAAGSPEFAYQAGMERLRRESAPAVADAATRARLEALALQRELLAGSEDRRLAAQQYQSGLGTESEFGLLGHTLGTERDIADRGVGVERDIGNRLLDTERYLQDRGQSLEMHGEQSTAQRLNEKARNRQAIEMGNQQERYGRGMDIRREIYGREHDIAGARRQDEREARGYVTDQGRYYGGRAEAAQERRSRDRINAASLGSENARTLLAAREPSWFNRNITPFLMKAADAAAAGAAAKPGGIFERGGVFSQPTNITIGEAGPEVVVPLNGGTPKQRSIMREHVAGQSATRKSQPKPYLGMAHNPHEVTPRPPEMRNSSKRRPSYSYAA